MWLLLLLFGYSLPVLGLRQGLCKEDFSLTHSAEVKDEALRNYLQKSGELLAFHLRVVAHLFSAMTHGALRSEHEVLNHLPPLAAETMQITTHSRVKQSAA